MKSMVRAIWMDVPIGSQFVRCVPCGLISPFDLTKPARASPFAFRPSAFPFPFRPLLFAHYPLLVALVTCSLHVAPYPLRLTL